MEIAVQLVVIVVGLALFWVFVRPLVRQILDRAAPYWRYYTLGIAVLAAGVGATVAIIRWQDPLLALLIAILAVDIFLPLTWARWRLVAMIERRAGGPR